MKPIEIIIYPLICILIPAFAFLEFSYFHSNGTENGLIELSQLVLIVSCIFIVSQNSFNHVKIAAILFSGFMSAVLIRELDFLFDLIGKGVWFSLVSMVFIWLIYVALKNWKPLKEELQYILNSAYLSILLIGLNILFIFSRLFGTTKLWKIIALDSYNRSIKTIVQEGTELLGYALIFAAVILFHLESEQKKYGGDGVTKEF